MTTRADTAALVLRLVQPGDTVTHTRCMGCMEEHIFLGLTLEGDAIQGRPTTDTARLGGSPLIADDIAPGSVTHINRMPIEVLEMASAAWHAEMAAASKKALLRR